MKPARTHDVCLDAVSKHYDAAGRQAVWRWIQKNQPALAELLKQMQSDPFVQGLREECGATLWIQVVGEVPPVFKDLPAKYIRTLRPFPTQQSRMH